MPARLCTSYRFWGIQASFLPFYPFIVGHCRIIAEPHLRVAERSAIQLESVSLCAADDSSTYQWQYTDVERLIRTFARIVSLRDAYEIVNKLRDGLVVEFQIDRETSQIKTELDKASEEL